MPPAPIHLIGSGQTPFGEHWELSIRDLIDSAITAAIDDAPCTALDIDLVIVANMLSPQMQLGALASSMLPHHPPALRAEAACASGAVALHTACGMLESGKAETILVIGVEKMTDASPADIAAGLMGAADQELDAPSGLTFPGIFGLIATRYMHEYGLTREQLNLVSAHHHAQAVENPNAQFRTAIPPEKISTSSRIADPLCLLDCSPISDGAAAVILSTAIESPLCIAASSLATDAVSITERPEITSFPATKDAVERAFEEAEVSASEIDHIELHDCFSIAALIALEDLGYANPGHGIALYEKPSTPTVNASGGLKACGHPVAATGIKQICDLRKQLTASGNRYGLAHNFGGAGATCAIHILEQNPT